MKISKKLKLLILVSAVLLVLFVTGSILKTIFLRQIKEKIQSNFEYSQIYLSVFPPTLVIEDVKSTSESPLVSAKKISVGISYRSLLTKEKPFKVFVEHPVLRVGQPSLEKEEKDKAKLSLAIPFIIERGIIKDGEIYYSGEDIQVQSKGIDALFTQEKELFTVQAEVLENAFSLRSDQPQFEGKVSLFIEGQGKKINIRRIKISGPRGILRAEGSVLDPLDPELQLNTSFNVQTDLIADLFALPFEWEGRTEGKGDLIRKDKEIAFSAGLLSQDVILNSVPMGNVDGRIDFKQKSGGTLVLNIEKKNLNDEFVRMHFKGDQVEGILRGFHLEPIMNYMTLPWPIFSPAWGTFKIDRMRIRAELEFRDQVLEAEASRYPLQGQVKVNWDGVSKFSFSSESLSSSFAKAKLEGEGIVDREVDVSISGEVKDVKQAREFTSLILQKDFTFPEIRGKGRTDIRIFGDFKLPNVKTNFSISPAGFDQFNFESAKGDAEVIKNDFFGKFYIEDPSMKGKIDLFANEKEVKADIQLYQGDVKAILPALNIPFSLEGEASGNFMYEQLEEKMMFSGAFSSLRLQFADQVFTHVRGKVDWHEDSFSFPELQFEFHGGVIKGFSIVRLKSREFDLDIQAEKINLSSIYPDIEGELSANLKGKGSLDKDVASGQFELKDLYLKPFQKTEAKGDMKLGYAQDQISLNLKGNFYPGENEFDVSLYFPLKEDLLSGDIKGSFANFDLLLPWKGAKGQINYLFEIKGSRKLPQAKGAIDFQGSVFPFPRFAHAFRDYSGLIFVENRDLTLRSFKGKLGGGDVQGSGTVKLGKNGVETIDLRAEGKDLQLSPLERTMGLGEGSLRLTKDADRFVLEGDLFVHKLSWRREIYEKFVFSSIPYYQVEREPQFFDDLTLNIRIRSDDNAWMENSLGRVRGRFDLTVTGNVNFPILLGDIETIEGDVYFQDRKFKLLRGKISFLNPLTIEPYLSFTAETYVKDYRVTFSLEGLLDKLNPEFSSSPPLPPEDVLALLAMGESFKRTYQYDRSTQLSTASFITFQLSEEAKKRAQSIFSIDRFRIDPFIMGSSAEMTARLTLGKKISRNFFILYSTNLTTQREELTRIEWELTSDLSVVSTRDEKGRISIDVKIHKRF